MAFYSGSPEEMASSQSAHFFTFSFPAVSVCISPLTLTGSPCPFHIQTDPQQILCERLL